MKKTPTVPTDTTVRSAAHPAPAQPDRSAVEAVLHELQHGLASEGDVAEIAWCARALADWLASTPHQRGTSSGATAERPPVDVGDVVLVAAARLSCTNDVGGTTSLTSLPACEVRITRSFWDYETGWHFHAELLDPALAEAARHESTTGYSYDHYAERYPLATELLDRVATAARSFDPSRVYFSEFDLAPK